MTITDPDTAVAIPIPCHLDIDDLIACIDHPDVVAARRNAGGPAYEWANGLLVGVKVSPPSRLDRLDEVHAMAAVAWLTESQYARLAELAAGSPTDPVARIDECRRNLHGGTGGAAA